jgi:hypothetical protein
VSTSLTELCGRNDGFSDSSEVVFADIVLHNSRDGGHTVADTGKVSG